MLIIIRLLELCIEDNVLQVIVRTHTNLNKLEFKMKSNSMLRNSKHIEEELIFTNRFHSFYLVKKTNRVRNEKDKERDIFI
jgi:hypothetical protein